MQSFSTISKSSGDRNEISSAGKPSSFFKPVIQPKLTINQPNDIYEQEADAVADKVMRMTDNETVQGKFFKPAISSVQRKCEHCEKEEKKMQRKEMNGEEATADNTLESYVGSLSSGGQPLPDEVRNFYEPRLGYDFSNVKVHSDSVAAKSAQSINALAYTSGNHIVFNNGKYSPNTDSGKRLLGHELVHVIQQKKKNSSFIGTKIQRAMICSKRLEAFIGALGINHAYIDDTGRNDCLGSGMTGNYAVQTLCGGNFLRGCALKTDRSTDPQSYTPKKKQCLPRPGVTDLSRCLRDAYNSYSNPSVYRNPFGPNSNTFASTLAASCCVDSSDSGLGIVPGWGQTPPTTCECDLRVAAG